MGEKDTENRENHPQFSSVDKGLEKRPVSFREDPFQAHMDWLERNMGEDASRRTSEKIVKFMLKAESKWQIGVMKIFLKANTERGDDYFDKVRENIVGMARDLPNYSLFKDQGATKQSEIQRWLISTYVGGLLNAARGDTQFDTSMKGIAWSILAKDGKSLLAERGQTVDDKWLFDNIGPLMRTNIDPKTIGTELTKFIEGDPRIIHT